MIRLLLVVVALALVVWLALQLRRVAADERLREQRENERARVARNARASEGWR